jgi:hypothetical protein
MTTATKRKQPDDKPRPALHVQVGSVRIAIWKNAAEGGTEYFKAGQPELSYKDKEGRWQTGKSYGERDLVNLLKAAALAHTELVQRNRPETAHDDEPPELVA